MYYKELQNDIVKLVKNVCLLDDGRKVSYNMCHPEGETLEEDWLDIFEYIGTGVIYSVAGVVQEVHLRRYNFYIYKK